MSSGTLVAFKIFAFPRADARWVAALPDAVYASVRLRRVVRGTGLLSDQPRLEYVPNRRAADPHAGRRYGRLPQIGRASCRERGYSSEADLQVQQKMQRGRRV